VESRPFDDIARAVAKDESTRRGILRMAAVAGVGASSFGLAVDALAKKKKHKKKCKKPKPAALQTEIIACPGPRNSPSGGARRFAQTFTAAQTGVLTTALVEVSPVPIGGTDFVIDIRSVDSDGVPTSEILASVDIFDVPQTGADPPLKLAALFDPPAKVVKDQQYAVAVTDTQASSSSGYSVSLRSGNACAGQVFSDTVANGTFTPIPGFDLVFAVSITF
jgi:hypothetical protein